MRINIINKSNGRSAGHIKSSQISLGCFIDLQYQANSKVIKEIQKVLLKYYDLKYISGESGKKRSSLIISGVKNNPSKRYGLSYHTHSKEVKGK